METFPFEQKDTYYGFAAIKLSEEAEIIKLIKQYEFKWIIAGFEKTDTGAHPLTNGEHVHFIYETSMKTHDAFKKALLRKYNLGSKNQKDKPAYGFPNKKINDIIKLQAYTIKNLRFYVQGITDEQIAILKTYAYVKTEKRDSHIEYCDYLQENLSSFQLTDEYDEDYNLVNKKYANFDFRMMENLIFRYFRLKNDKSVITYHRIHYIGSYYLQNYHPSLEEDNLLYLKKRF